MLLFTLNANEAVYLNSFSHINPFLKERLNFGAIHKTTNFRSLLHFGLDSDKSFFTVFFRRLMKFIAFLSELPKKCELPPPSPLFRFRLLLLLQLYLSHFLRFMSNIIVGNGITLPLGRNSNSTNYIKLRERGIICCKSMGAKTMSIIKGSTNMLHLPQIL